MFNLIDSHAHLDELEDLSQAIQRAKEKGVIAIITVGSGYESNIQTLEIAEKYKPYVYPALGLHPWNLSPDSNIDRNLQFIEDNIQSIVAIGEVGLDYHKELVRKADKLQQKSCLEAILELAKNYQKPVIIHSRYAWRDSFTLVREARVEKAIFHWYTGPLSVLGDILQQGYFISATLAAEYHEEHRRALKATPLESLLLETDAPVVYREGTQSEHQAEPADVLQTLEAVAKLKDIELDIVADKTTQNALKFYGIESGKGIVEI